MSDEQNGLIIATIIIFVILVALILILIICHRNRASPCFRSDSSGSTDPNALMELPADLIARIPTDFSNLNVRHLQSYDSIIKDKMTLPPEYDFIIVPSYAEDEEYQGGNIYETSNAMEGSVEDVVVVVVQQQSSQRISSHMNEIPGSIFVESEGETNPTFTEEN